MVPRQLQNKLFLAALLVIAAVNVFVLGRIYVNRSVEPDSFVELTERELRPVYSSRYENSGLSLRIVWRTYNKNSKDSGYWSSYTSPDWFDAGKLRELGFNVPTSGNHREKGISTYNPLPKKVYVVLEQDSPLHAERLAQLEMNIESLEKQWKAAPENENLRDELDYAEKRLVDEKQGGSRLYVVDAGLRPEELRETYPDRTRYIVAKAIVNVQSDYSPKQPVFSGQIKGLAITNVHVSKKFRDRYPLLTDRDRSYWNSGAVPRFRANLAYGRQHEPWLQDVTPLEM